MNSSEYVKETAPVFDVVLTHRLHLVAKSNTHWKTARQVC